MMHSHSSNPKDKAQGPNNKNVISSETIFNGKKEVVIIHGETSYRLLITKAGKLILNK